MVTPEELEGAEWLSGHLFASSVPRVKGWRMPDGAIYVGRPTLWGNSYQIGTWSNTLGREVQTIEEAVRMYREVVWSEPHMQAYAREILRGKALVCWCKLDQPCHADVLIEIANG